MQPPLDLNSNTFSVSSMILEETSPLRCSYTVQFVMVTGFQEVILWVFLFPYTYTHFPSICPVCFCFSWWFHVDWNPKKEEHVAFRCSFFTAGLWLKGQFFLLWFLSWFMCFVAAALVFSFMNKYFTEFRAKNLNLKPFQLLLWAGTLTASQVL